MTKPNPAAHLVVTGYENMDMRAVHALLTEAYWSKGVAFEVVDQAARHSLCFGVIRESRQIGFARVVTDKATFAYLADATCTKRTASRVWPACCSMPYFSTPTFKACAIFCCSPAMPTACIKSMGSRRSGTPHA